MDTVCGGTEREAENESLGIVDRLVGCLQPVLTVLGKTAPKQHKPGRLFKSIFCHKISYFILYIDMFDCFDT